MFLTVDNLFPPEYTFKLSGISSIRGSGKVDGSLWQRCIRRLEGELSEQQINTWIRPLQAVQAPQVLRLYAPNRFVVDWVAEHYLERLSEIARELAPEESPEVVIGIGNAAPPQPSANAGRDKAPPRHAESAVTRLDRRFSFDNFVEGKSNQLARAAARQVSKNPGHAYNPLFIYGGVGLGKTHLMHAVGNAILHKNPQARVVYLNSERFVGDMVKALQHNTINQFKGFYRTVDALLIDDIQFFANKDRTQEEFFHTFNTLLENHRQVILTCDRYPKEVNGLEERLKSRFGWGLTVAIEPPELETSVAILKTKAGQAGFELPNEVAFLIARRIRSNVRELEGALKRVIANSNFTGKPITLDFAREALRDLLALHDRLVTIDNIQKTVSEYYKIRVSDLQSKSRSRSVTRPRQVAMALAKELTSHSLPEIGDRFGGRDHTTVLHACRKVRELRDQDLRISEDYQNLLRTLSA